MKQAKAIVSLLIIAIIVVGSGIYMWQRGWTIQSPTQKVVESDIPETLTKGRFEKSEPLSYSIEGVSAIVSKSTAPFMYTAHDMKVMAYGCDPIALATSGKTDAENEKIADKYESDYRPGYFENIVETFKDTQAIIYNFKYQGDNQDDGVYTITLLPNKAGYASLDQFKKDFDLCYAGGKTYPTMLNSNWLLFSSACGTGYDDGSGLPHGCEEVQKIIDPSLRLN